jgi:transposase
MMGTKERAFAPIVAVSLEALVPPDHFYRHLQRTLNLSFVRTLVQETYAAAGRPSIDPEVFFKLQLVMFFEDIRSERLLMRLVADRLSVRWYLGYNLDEPLPDHSSLSRIRTRYGLEVFRQFFDAILEQCHQAKLVWGKEMYFDATQVQANADLDSLTPRFAVEARAAIQAHLAALFPDEDTQEEQPEGSGGPAEVPMRTLPSANTLPPLPTQLPVTLPELLRAELAAANAARHDWIVEEGRPQRDVHGYYQRTADFRISTTDPDATPMRLKGGGTHLGYQTHYVVDGGKRRIILQVLVTPGEVMENQPMLDLLWRVCFRWHLWPDQVTGDTTYGTANIITALEQQQIRPYVPLPDFDHRTEFFGQRDFRYEAERDVYVCPNGAELHLLPSGCTEQFQQYRAQARVCNACPRNRTVYDQ